MEQTLSQMVGVRKLAARNRLTSLFNYDSRGRRTRTENSTELEEKLKNRMDEAQVRLGDSIEAEMLCVWRKEAIVDFAYSAWKVTVLLKEFEEEEFYFRKRDGREDAAEVQRVPGGVGEEQERKFCRWDRDAACMP